MERERSSSNNGGAKNTRKEKKTKRRELLEKKKEIEGVIRAASAVKDHLSLFPSFRNYSRNGLSLYFESGLGDNLSSSLKRYIQRLLKINMEGHYGSKWVAEAKVKHKESVAPDAHYIFVHEASNASATQTPMDVKRESMSGTDGRGPVVGFVHFRFVVEEEIPVLYVYEVQLEPSVQGKGLGKFLMRLIELIAHKNCMGAVVLTVQRANKLALNFYLHKLRYNISATSPSRVDPLVSLDLRRAMKFFVKHSVMKLNRFLSIDNIFLGTEGVRDASAYAFESRVALLLMSYSLNLRGVNSRQEAFRERRYARV